MGFDSSPVQSARFGGHVANAANYGTHGTESDSEALLSVATCLKRDDGSWQCPTVSVDGQTVEITDLSALTPHDDAAAGNAIVEQLGDGIASLIIDSSGVKPRPAERRQIERATKKTMLAFGSDTFMNGARDAVATQLPQLGDPATSVSVDVTRDSNDIDHRIVVRNTSTWRADDSAVSLTLESEATFHLSLSGGPESRLTMEPPLVKRGKQHGDGPFDAQLDAIAARATEQQQALPEEIEVEVCASRDPADTATSSRRSPAQSADSRIAGSSAWRKSAAQADNRRAARQPSTRPAERPIPHAAEPGAASAPPSPPIAKQPAKSPAWSDNKLLASIYTPWTPQSWAQAFSEVSALIRPIAHAVANVVSKLSPVAIASYILRAIVSTRMAWNEIKANRQARRDAEANSPFKGPSADSPVQHASQFLRWKDATHKLAVSTRQLGKKMMYFLRNGPTALGSTFFKALEFVKEVAKAVRPADVIRFAGGAAAVVAKSFFSFFSAALSMAQGAYDWIQASRVLAAAEKLTARWRGLKGRDGLSLGKLARVATREKSRSIERENTHSVLFQGASEVDKSKLSTLTNAFQKTFGDNQERATVDAKTERFRGRIRVAYGVTGVALAALAIATGGTALVAIGAISAVVSAVWTTYSAYKYIRKTWEGKVGEERVNKQKQVAAGLKDLSVRDLEATFESDQSLRENGYVVALMTARYLVCEGAQGVGPDASDRVRRKLAADLLLAAGMDADSLHHSKVLLRNGKLSEGVAFIEKYLVGGSAREAVMAGNAMKETRTRNAVADVARSSQLGLDPDTARYREYRQYEKDVHALFNRYGTAPTQANLDRSTGHGPAFNETTAKLIEQRKRLSPEIVKKHASEIAYLDKLFNMVLNAREAA